MTRTDVVDPVVERGERLGFMVSRRERAHTGKAHYVMVLKKDTRLVFDWDGTFAATAFLTGWEMRGKLHD
jgi:hypothetical protein